MAPCFPTASPRRCWGSGCARNHCGTGLSWHAHQAWSLSAAKLAPAHGIGVPKCEGRQAFTSKREPSANPPNCPNCSIGMKWSRSTLIDAKTQNAPAASPESCATSDLPTPHSRRTKGKFANLSVPVRRYRGMHAPGCSAAWEDAEAAGYTFNFQISSSRGRQGCSVKVQAQNFQDATQFIRQNWPIIERMAREELAKGCRHIELAAP